MPKGVRLSLSDKLARLLMTTSVDNAVDALADMFALGIKDPSMEALHQVLGELHVRAATRRQEAIDVGALRRKPGPKPGTKYGPRKKKA